MQCYQSIMSLSLYSSIQGGNCHANIFDPILNHDSLYFCSVVMIYCCMMI